jgi:hypothetical protein
MYKVKVDVEQIRFSGTVAGTNDVAVPYLLSERLRHGSLVADRDDLDGEGAAVRSLVVDRLADIAADERLAER